MIASATRSQPTLSRRRFLAASAALAPAAPGAPTATVPTASPGRRERLVAIASWPAVAWTGYVFLGSLPYKFTNHPDTQHIFGTIGDWLGGFLGTGIGTAFARLGGYAVGSVELVTTLVLLAPIALWLLGKALGRRIGPSRATLHAIGGAMAATVMAGAAFFHLASPLGVVVLHEGQSDGGSLFVAAVSILALGTALAVANGRLVRRR